MRDVKKVLEMRSQNYSQRQISHSLKVPRDTVRKIFNNADEKKLIWSSAQNVSEAEVQKLLFGKEEVNLIITTIKLLWEEYAELCRSAQILFYHYRYFSEKYREYVKKHNLTIQIIHKPGDKLQADDLICFAHICESWSVPSTIKTYILV